MAEKSIGTLVEGARSNDQTAINELYGRTVNKAYFVAKRIMSDEDQIADILQDSYIKALCSLDTLSDPEKFQGWLDTIVINKCKDYLKKKKPLLFTELESDDENDASLEFEDISTAFSPEASVDYGETKRLVGEMIDRLPEDQKICLLMYYYEERGVNEIAEILDCSPNTVKSRLNYARKNLKVQVLDLEKKGTKLYCMPLVPFLYWFFRQSLLDTLGSGAAGVVGSMASSTVGSASGGVVENVAGNAAGNAAGNVTENAAGNVAGNATGSAVGNAAGSGVVSTAGKVVGFGIKKALLVAAVGSAVAFGGNKVYQTMVQTPEHTIEKFADAYNEWDLDKMMACMGPRIQRQYRSVRGITSLFGLDPADLFAGALGLSQMIGDDSGLGTIVIRVRKVTYTDSTHAVAVVEMMLGDLEPSTGTVYLQKIDGKWYIME